MTTKPVYKKVQNTEKFIQVGQVDEYGYLEFDVPTYESIGNVMPQLFYPEFYIEQEDIREVTRWKDILDDEGNVVKREYEPPQTVISGYYKKVFTPKNMPTQLVSLSGSTFLEPNDYLVTGYVDKNGIAVYYDQYIEG